MKLKRMKPDVGLVWLAMKYLNAKLAEQGKRKQCEVTHNGVRFGLKWKETGAPDETE